MDLSVIVPTHNPHEERLKRTLQALRGQSLPLDRWETILVNNASTHFPSESQLNEWGPANLRCSLEPQIGLSSARRNGFKEAQGAVFVLVDDDNVLAPDYLERVLVAFNDMPLVGLLGGKSLPDFETAPDPWVSEFLPLLALRDLGEKRLCSSGLVSPTTRHLQYPSFAPIGAGMALRREAALAWLEAIASDPAHIAFDRRGESLASSGDNDIVLCAMKKRWEVAYCPELQLRHLIPSTRLAPAYLQKLNYSIQRSWMHLLIMHGASPWESLTRPGAFLRKVKAWMIHRPWTSQSAKIRYAGVKGHFDGRIR